uniref:Reverse transcriptase domain-containing protein n=1 Tax=Seriola lalandi dorsalis TaxID=1841481 RepID=A0A3B4WXR4_SERLL
MNPRSRVRVNGQCSDFFDLERGTRQGDALWPALFALSIEPLAELIRSNPLIQGIRDESGNQHKIALYADDILLFIENPVHSIPALLQSLNEYGLVSGYKVNPSKSEAMMVSGTWPSQLDDIVSFRRSKQGFKYLGIVLTPQVTQLYQANYKKTFGIFKNELARWDVLPLSLLGRVEAVKMNLLPRILFLFQSLPVGIPTSTFNMLDKLISKFIWQNKRPRVRLKTLTLGKDKGGLGLPDIQLYFWAAQLRPLFYWFRDDEAPSWTQIESDILNTEDLSHIPYCFNIKTMTKCTNNPIITHSLRIWDKINRFLGLGTSLSPLTPIGSNPSLDFVQKDLGFKIWGQKNINKIGDLPSIFPEMWPLYSKNSQYIGKYTR